MDTTTSASGTRRKTIAVLMRFAEVRPLRNSCRFRKVLYVRLSAYPPACTAMTSAGLTIRYSGNDRSSDDCPYRHTPTVYNRRLREHLLVEERDVVTFVAS
jgi:hypothetical protein